MKGGMLISARALFEQMANGEVLVFDCRFDLMHPNRGRQSWLAAHIPGAVYAHLDDNLSGRVTTSSGRHPLPAVRSFASFLARSGWTPDRNVVAYDSDGGALAARLWWLMKYFGLEGVSLLDGGIGAWVAESLPLESGTVRIKRRSPPELTANPAMVMNTQAVADGLQHGEITLVDVRSPERFRGESEPIDPVAGHVPGAVNHPVGRNLGENLRFRNGNELQAVFRQLIGKQDPARTVAMCGSGVTACQLLFAMELAGYGGGRLYAGSWSEWIRDPARPVAQGKISQARVPSATLEPGEQFVQ